MATSYDSLLDKLAEIYNPDRLKQFKTMREAEKDIKTRINALLARRSTNSLRALEDTMGD